MWPISAAALQVLRSSHQVEHRITTYTAAQGELVLDALADGSVTVDSKSQVRRTASVDIASADLWPLTPLDALSPLGAELGVEYGIVVPGVGTEWIPVLRGPVQTAKGKLIRTYPTSADGGRRGGILVSGLGVSVSGRAQRIIDDRLTAPAQLQVGAGVVAEITRLIRETIPDAEVLDQTGGSTATITAAVTVEKDRWGEGVVKIADSYGLEVYDDPLGRFVIRNQPSLDDPPVWRVDVGDGGVLISADLSQDRSQVYNGVMASGETTDGTTPVSALVVDDDPASPTFWGGQFGKKVRYFKSPLLATPEQCAAAARTQLEKVRGAATTVQLSAVTNPGLEGGDVIEVDMGNGYRQLHIVDSVPVPLRPGEQSLTTRSVELPAEQ